MSIVDTTVENKRIKELTEEEDRVLNGVLNPSKTIDKSTRPKFLEIQLKNIKKTIAETEKIIKHYRSC